MGFILRARLNGVLMGLEGCGCRKVRVPFPGVKLAKNRRWEDRWKDKVEGQF